MWSSVSERLECEPTIKATYKSAYLYFYPYCWSLQTSSRTSICRPLRQRSPRNREARLPLVRAPAAVRVLRTYSVVPAPGRSTSRCPRRRRGRRRRRCHISPAFGLPNTTPNASTVFCPSTASTQPTPNNSPRSVYVTSLRRHIVFGCVFCLFISIE